MDDTAIACTECGREVDEFATIAEKWLSHYDGSGLVPFCPGVRYTRVR